MESYAVFLSHNSSDKAAVRGLFFALKARGVSPWFDEEHLIPGRPWQAELESIITTIPAAAVLVGRDGIGPWENMEMRSLLAEFVRRKLPVIPVLLPGAPHEPRLPLFLSEFTWVDLRAGLSKAGLDRLIWGITGQKPIEVESFEPAPASEIQRPSLMPSATGESKLEENTGQKTTKATSRGLSRRLLWVIGSGFSLAFLAVGISPIFNFALPLWKNREALSRPLMPCPAGEPMPIEVSDSVGGLPANPGFTVIAEERVWDLRRLTFSEAKVAGIACQTRHIELRRDTTQASSFEYQFVARAGMRFWLIINDSRLSMRMLRSPQKGAPSMVGDSVYEYRGIVDCRQIPVGERFRIEVQADSRDVFADRSRWWVAMPISDNIERVAMRVVFPSGSPFYNHSFRRYSAGKQFESVSFEGLALSKLRAQPELIWTVNHPAKGSIYRVSWDW